MGSFNSRNRRHPARRFATTNDPERTRLRRKHTQGQATGESGGAMCAPDIMECGGKRSAKPLYRKSRQGVCQNQRSSRGPKRRRRCALPAHSIRSWPFRRLFDTCRCELRMKMRPRSSIAVWIWRPEVFSESKRDNEILRLRRGRAAATGTGRGPSTRRRANRLERFANPS
jgi:hypothetical protein